MAAGGIDTPHIVRVLDAGRDRVSGMPFIAMEYLSGLDLDRIVARFGALPVNLALRIAAQACAGLESAHAAGIVHRDIKPANLFVAHQEHGLVVKLLDFGIAKLPMELLTTLGRQGATTTGKLLGSPLYMSPEQAKGLRTLDHRTDIWSLGAVLYTMLAGQTPYADHETVGQIIVAICSQKPRPLAEVAPGVPEAVVRLVERTLSIDIQSRHPSATALLSELRALVAGGIEINEEELALPTDPGGGSQQRMQFLSGETTRCGAFSEKPKVTSRLKISSATSAPEPGGALEGPSPSSGLGAHGAGSTLQSERPNRQDVRKRGPLIGAVAGLLLVAGIALVSWMLQPDESETQALRQESGARATEFPTHPAPSLMVRNVAETDAAAGARNPTLDGGSVTAAVPTLQALRPGKNVAPAQSKGAGSQRPALPVSKQSAPASSGTGVDQSSFSTLDKNFE
jgi:eukaryotic-like serine/threonine-protein kinase